MKNKAKFRHYQATFSLVFFASIITGCNNSNVEEPCVDSAVSEEMTEDDLARSEFYGYWSGGNEEIMVGEEEIIYVYDRILNYRGSYEICEDQLVFCEESGMVNMWREFRLLPEGLLSDQGYLLQRDGSRDRITWDNSSQEQKEDYEQQQQYSDGYNTQSQGAFHSESDVFKYCSKSGFTNKNGVTIRISSTGINFNGSIMGNSIYDQIPTFGLGYSSKITVEIESPDVAFLKFRDHNDEGWEAVVNSSNGTIEFGWAGNRDFVFRKLVPNYDVFYKK